MVEYMVAGRVATIMLARPEARNAIDGEMARQLDAALARAEAADEVWVVVLASRGPVFCAGADLKAISAEGADALSTDNGFGGLTERVRSKPLIAAVDGPALAGGFELCLACDIVVASSTSTFGLPEVRHGLLAGAGGLVRLPQIVGPQNALAMALTGAPADAMRAYELGLVSVLVEPGDALREAQAVAERIAANAPLAVQASRRVVLASVWGPEEYARHVTRNNWARLSTTDDFEEGPRAFIEKRAPVWTGR